MTRNPKLPIAGDRADLGAPIRVSLLTDDPLLRAGLSGVLGASIEVVDGDGGAEVTLWDAGVDPERALARLGELQTLPGPVVAIVADPGHVAPALAAGARGVVLRDQVGPGLHAALAAVRSGLTVVDNALAAGLLPAGAAVAVGAVQPAGGGVAKGRGELTDRERQVVQLMTDGLSNKLIADRLGISDHTAKFHVNGVMIKLGASTRTEAVVEAIRRGVIRL
jgi:DNA-binding NarL/FixJ family response regulator